MVRVLYVCDHCLAEEDERVKECFAEIAPITRHEREGFPDLSHLRQVPDGPCLCECCYELYIRDECEAAGHLFECECDAKMDAWAQLPLPTI